MSALKPGPDPRAGDITIGLALGTSAAPPDAGTSPAAKLASRLLAAGSAIGSIRAGSRCRASPCIIEVPNGATVSETDAGVTVVTVDGGVVAT